jgi:hypothetical protein
MNFGTTPPSFFFPWVSNNFLKVASSAEGVRGGDCSPTSNRTHRDSGENDSVGRTHHKSGPLGVWD